MQSSVFIIISTFPTPADAEPAFARFGAGMRKEREEERIPLLYSQTGWPSYATDNRSARS